MWRCWQLQDEHDVYDDVSDSCQSSEVDTDKEVDVNPASRAFQLTVRGLYVLGRLLLAVVKAVLRLWTSSHPTDDGSTRSTTTSQPQPTCSDDANWSLPTYPQLFYNDFSLVTFSAEIVITKHRASTGIRSGWSLHPKIISWINYIRYYLYVCDTYVWVHCLWIRGCIFIKFLDDMRLDFGCDLISDTIEQFSSSPICNINVQNCSLYRC